ncbi:hypothetical protein FT663_05032 [Candidozyma haemuli var. vulneris]|nr:hypothetical protein FT662_05084 [[Candida] haemuloni var. vulneris]KAF3986067.1 hypothetical protein FT663_05032 [[Candida] haemuloni var. vulneris]
MSQLNVPKQRRSFAAKPSARRFSETFYVKPKTGNDKPRAVSEKPNLLQMDLRRSSRYNMDLSSAVASYVPGSLEIDDIPAVPVYNRATGKFRVFSSPERGGRGEGSPQRSDRTVQGTEYSRSSSSSSEMFNGAQSFDKAEAFEGSLGSAFHGASGLLSSSDQRPERRAFSENHGSRSFYQTKQPFGSSQTISSHSTLDPRQNYQGRFYDKPDLPPLPKAATESISSGSGSELFSSGSQSGDSSSEPEFSPRQPQKPALQSLDELSGGFLGHVPRRSVSTISTCRTVESGAFNDEVDVMSVLTSMDSIASEGSLWNVPTSEPEQSRSVTPKVEEPRQIAPKPEQASPPKTPKPASSQKYSSLLSSSPIASSSPVPKPPAKDIPLPKTKKLPPVPAPKTPSPKKVAFCLDSGAEYDKSRFMIPKEYKLEPKAKKTVKPRAVSQPDPILQPFHPVAKRHSQPIPVSKLSPVSLPASSPHPASQPTSPTRSAASQPVPFRTNVRIRGPI